MLLVFSLVTTDVQSISLCVVTWPGNWTVNCSYVTNSNARGCHYRLITRFRARANITGVIARENTQGVFLDIHDISAYQYIVAYDWEADGSIGTYPVRRYGDCY